MSTKVKPIQTGLCAFGMSGRVFHAPFLDCLPEFSLTAVVERHQKTAANYYPQIRSYNSVEEMLANDSLSLIIVNTPNATHFDYTKRALLASKHVVVEKPFTATVKQAKELIDLSKVQNKLLAVYQNRRWDSDFLAVKKVVENNSLGKLIE